jgi:hypothetical protein
MTQPKYLVHDGPQQSRPLQTDHYRAVPSDAASKLLKEIDPTGVNEVFIVGSNGFDADGKRSSGTLQRGVKLSQDGVTAALRLLGPTDVRSLDVIDRKMAVLLDSLDALKAKRVAVVQRAWQRGGRVTLGEVEASLAETFDRLLSDE